MPEVMRYHSEPCQRGEDGVRGSRAARRDARWCPRSRPCRHDSEFAVGLYCAPQPDVRSHSAIVPRRLASAHNRLIVLKAPLKPDRGEPQIFGREDVASRGSSGRSPLTHRDSHYQPGMLAVRMPVVAVRAVGNSSCRRRRSQTRHPTLRSGA
jgi:hypothetical protein